jgi:hypothetical protein
VLIACRQAPKTKTKQVGKKKKWTSHYDIILSLIYGNKFQLKAKVETSSKYIICSFSLEEFIYNYLITLSNYIIPKKGV